MEATNELSVVFSGAAGFIAVDANDGATKVDSSVVMLAGAVGTNAESCWASMVARFCVGNSDLFGCVGANVVLLTTTSFFLGAVGVSIAGEPGALVLGEATEFSKPPFDVLACAAKNCSFRIRLGSARRVAYPLEILWGAVAATCVLLDFDALIAGFISGVVGTKLLLSTTSAAGCICWLAVAGGES